MRVRGEREGNLSASKELTAAGAVIEGDFPRGQMLGQLGQSTAKLYTANVQEIYTLYGVLQIGRNASGRPVPYTVTEYPEIKESSCLAAFFSCDLTVIPLIIKGVMQLKSNVFPVRKNLANKIYRGRAGMEKTT